MTKTYYQLEYRWAEKWYPIGPQIETIRTAREDIAYSRRVEKQKGHTQQYTFRIVRISRRILT